MMIAAVLVMAACGGASESSVGTRASPSGSVPALGEAARAAVEVSADALISTMGDERTALAAVLLAGDRGYGVDQIVPAGVEGRLQPGGLIMSADGTPLTPDYLPSEILDDDVTADASEASGFRSPPTTLRLTVVLNRLRQSFGDDRGSLVTILLFFEFGYSLEQIVLAVLADGSVEFGRGCLVDENGNVIGPEQSPKDAWVGWCKAATSTTVTPADTTAPGVTGPEGTESLDDESDADGSNDEGPLSGTWSMWWRNAENSENVAFTLRFDGLNTGTVEVLNDEDAFDSWFEFEDDVLRFGFTRMFEPPANWPAGNPFPAGGWPENSTFEGTRDSDGQFLGKWYRDDWECRPELSPPCSYKDVRTFSVAWVERES